MAFWKTFFMCLVAGVAVAAGIALIFCSGGAALALGAFAGFAAKAIAGGLICAGIGGFATAIFNKDCTWKEFGKQFGINFVIGAVTAGFSAGAAFLVKSCVQLVGATGWKVFLLYGAINIPSFAGISMLTNGIANWLSGHKFFENAGRAVIIGALLGVITTAADGWRLWNLNRAEKVANGMLDTALAKLKGGVEKIFKSFVSRRLQGVVRYCVKFSLEVAASAGQDMFFQYIINGKIGWKMVAFRALAFGAVKAAIDGIRYRQAKKDNKLMREGFKHNEEVADEHAKRRQENKKENERRAEANRARRAKREDIKNMKRQNRAEAKPDENLSGDTPEMEENWQERIFGQNSTTTEGTSRANPATTEGTSRANPATTEGTSQANLAATEGTSQANLVAPAEMTTSATNGRPERNANDNPKCTAVVQDNRTNAIYTGCSFNERKHQTSSKQAYIDMSNHPGITVRRNDKGQERACAEVDAVIKMKCHNTENNIPIADLKKDTTLFTTGTGNDNCTVVVKPPCSSCKSIPCRNLSDIKTLIVHLAKQYMSLESGVQPPLYAGEKKDESSRDSKFNDSNSGSSKKRKVTPPRTQEHSSRSDAELAMDNSEEDRGRSRVIAPSTQTSNHYTDSSQLLSSNAYDEPFARGGDSKKPQKTARTFPLIYWDDEENKYMIIKSEDLSFLPEDTRMVAVTGVHKSGRTTLIHSLLHQWGYALTEDECIIITRVRSGVMMYWLDEDNIAILDCCDSMDCIGDAQDEESPMAPYFLDVFCYVTCNHLVYSMPFTQENLSESANVCDFLRKRLAMLRSAAGLSNGAGRSRVSIALRHDSLTAEEALSFNHLKSNLDSQFASPNREDQIMSLLEELHNIKTFPLRYFQESHSIADDDSYKAELQQLADCLMAEEKQGD